jgi:hypothetical protein
MYNFSDSSPTLTNCTFSRNLAKEYGGAMVNSAESNPILTNCIFIANSAYSCGGGMENLYSSSPTLTNCLFSGNLAHNRWGGGIYNWRGGNLTLAGCTFADNSSPNGNALACDSRNQQEPSNLEIINCILWNGGNEIWNNDNSVISITYSDVQAGWPGVGNIDTDPCFVSLGYWDPNSTSYDKRDDFWVEGDYHLLPDSSCIDMGDPNCVAEPNETDLDGKPRVIGGRIDMGAYEYAPAILAEARIVPRTINLASKGKWISTKIRLPESYNVADIDPDSVLIDGKIQAVSLNIDEQEQIATARFRREDVKPVLEACQVELTITGQLTNGTIFKASDVVRVLNKGRPSLSASASGFIALNQYVGTCWDPNECPCLQFGDATCDGNVNLGDVLALKAAWGASPPWIPPKCCADFNRDGMVNLADLLAMHSGWCHICDPGSLNQSCPQ